MYAPKAKTTAAPIVGPRRWSRRPSHSRPIRHRERQVGRRLPGRPGVVDRPRTDREQGPAEQRDPAAQPQDEQEPDDEQRGQDAEEDGRDADHGRAVAEERLERDGREEVHRLLELEAGRQERQDGPVDVVAGRRDRPGRHDAGQFVLEELGRVAAEVATREGRRPGSGCASEDPGRCADARDAIAPTVRSGWSSRARSVAASSVTARSLSRATR